MNNPYLSWTSVGQGIIIRHKFSSLFWLHLLHFFVDCCFFIPFYPFFLIEAMMLYRLSKILVIEVKISWARNQINKYRTSGSRCKTGCTYFLSWFLYIFSSSIDDCKFLIIYPLLLPFIYILYSFFNDHVLSIIVLMYYEL